MRSYRRSDSLIPFSRQHQYALLLCMRIHRGLPVRENDEEWVRAKAAQAVRFFEVDLIPHFKAEEEVLFPSMRDFSSSSELLGELLAEHRRLERLVEQLRDEESFLTEVLKEFADLLEGHIRKEERQLFPIFEEEASDELAKSVGREITGLIGMALQPGDPDLLK